ncbi:MAG: sigma-70 family RNA polymerase sigma factor [Nitrospirota bacterium]
MEFLSDPDVVLMLRVRDGDRAAFDVLIDKYRRPLLNVIARTIGRDADAEDLAQDVFVRVYRAATRYEPNAKFSTWLYTIARRVCLNHARAQALRRWLPFAGDDADAQDSAPDPPDTRFPDPAADLERRELQRVVARAVAALPERLRFAVILRRYEELSYDEIADILGCSVTAAKLRVHRANALLADRLAPYVREKP